AALASSEPTAANHARRWTRRVRKILRAPLRFRSQDRRVNAGAVSVDDDVTRAHYIWTTLREAFDVGAKTNTWPRALKDLWVLRSNRVTGGLLHPKTIFGEPIDHPLLPRVSAARGLYTVETADNAIALMRDIYSACREVRV